MSKYEVVIEKSWYLHRDLWYATVKRISDGQEYTVDPMRSEKRLRRRITETKIDKVFKRYDREVAQSQKARDYKEKYTI